MRAAVISAVSALLCAGAAAGKVKLVSQSSSTGAFEGGGGLSIPIPGIGRATVNGTASLHIDAEKGNIIFTAKPTWAKSAAGGLFLGQAKRYYTYTPDDGCSYLDMPNMVEPGQFMECAEGLLQKGKKFFKNVYTIEDRQTESKLGPFSIGGKGILGLHIDHDGGIRTVDLGGSVSLLGLPLLIFGGEWKAANTVLGSPDASVFEVPAAWGECQKMKEDPFQNMDNRTKTEKRWLACFQPPKESDALMETDTLVV
jgi:hypothetical protein